MHTFLIQPTSADHDASAGRRHSIAGAFAAVLGVVAVVFGPQVYFDRQAAMTDKADDAPPAYAADSVPVVRCPEDPWAEVWWSDGGGPHDLVRGTPNRGLICAYAGLRTHVTAERALSAADVTDLVERLNELPDVPKGAVSCPNDDGSGFAVILSDGHALSTISIQRTGCAFVFSRNVASRADDALLGQLASLVGVQRAIRGSLAG